MPRAAGHVRAPRPSCCRRGSALRRRAARRRPQARIGARRRAEWGALRAPQSLGMERRGRRRSGTEREKSPRYKGYMVAARAGPRLTAMAQRARCASHLARGYARCARGVRRRPAPRHVSPRAARRAGLSTALSGEGRDGTRSGGARRGAPILRAMTRPRASLRDHDDLHVARELGQHLPADAARRARRRPRRHHRRTRSAARSPAATMAATAERSAHERRAVCGVLDVAARVDPRRSA